MPTTPEPAAAEGPPHHLSLSPPSDPEPPSPAAHLPQSASASSSVQASPAATPRAAASPSWPHGPRTIFRSSGVRPTKEDSIKRLPRVRGAERPGRAARLACVGCWF